MNRKRRTEALINQDLVQDVIEQHGSDGITNDMVVTITKLSYPQVQQATSALRDKGYVRYQRRSRRLYFFPK